MKRGEGPLEFLRLRAFSFWGNCVLYLTGLAFERIFKAPTYDMGN